MQKNSRKITQSTAKEDTHSCGHLGKQGVLASSCPASGLLLLHLQSQMARM